MKRAIDYFFITQSPYAYLGHDLLHEIAAHHGASIRYKPVQLPKVWENSGSVGLAGRTPLRQRYRRIELQRAADFRGLPLNVDPRYFPTDCGPADRVAIALVEAGTDPASYIRRVQQGVWVDHANIADPAQIEAFLEETGHDARYIMELADGSIVAAIYDRNTGDAIAADAVGVPVYVLDGEPFWGQDRLEQLNHALRTGRAPFRP